MEADTRYTYPSLDAEFGRYNFHRPAIVDKLTSLFVSDDVRSSRVIEMVGAPRSGRHYLLRAAAFEAQGLGAPTTVTSLDLAGYEPDRPLRHFIEHLAKTSAMPGSGRLLELAKRAKVELKLTPWSFLFVSLGIKWDPSFEELNRLLESPARPVGPSMSDREQFRRLLARVTQQSRLILHVRDGQTVDVALRARLIDESKLNTKLYVAFSVPEGDTSVAERSAHRVYVPQWNREEMERAITRDFRPVRISTQFVDFLWEASSTRESLARLLLRISNDSGLWVIASIDKKGAWVVEDGWQRNEALLKELARDLFDPIDDLLCRLPLAEQRQIREFLALASLCDPTVPVNQILATLGLGTDAADSFLDRVDELLGEEGQVPVFRDLGFANAGVPKSELVYRFLNPAVPGVILMRCSDSSELATRLLHQLSGALRPESRSVATMYLRLAEAAGSAAEAEKHVNQLRWWTSLEETGLMAAIVETSLREGDIAPTTIWAVIEATKDLWPPSRRLALVNAYGGQPGGVPVNGLFRFRMKRASLLLDNGEFEEASRVVAVALAGPLPEPRWLALSTAENIAGMVDFQLGLLASATAHFESCLQIIADHVGPDSLDYITVQSNLASVYLNQGRYAEAEPLFLRARAIRERVFGEEHPDTLVAVNNLASLYENQGRYGEAEPLYLKALAARERVQGEEHLETLVSANNLATLYTCQGRYRDAEPLFLRPLAAQERALGEEHPETLASVNSLASLYEHQGRYAEAEPLYLKALVALERLLGNEHPDTLASVNGLAILRVSQGRYAEAEPLCLRALIARERVLGAEHRDTLVSVNSLAELYLNQGRYEAAEPLYLRALAASERTLGSDHPDSLAAANNLANLYCRQGRYGEAEVLLVRALAKSEVALGAEHPGTLHTVNNLAALYEAQGRYGEAEPLCLRALAARERVLGDEHPDTLVSVNSLATLYANQGRYGEAEPLYLRALSARERVLGPEHRNTLESLKQLATLYESLGRHEEAERLRERTPRGDSGADEQ